MVATAPGNITAQNVQVRCQVNGQTFTPYGYTVHSGTYGSGGSCDIHTSVEALRAAGIDLIGLAELAPSSLPVDIYLFLDGDRTHLFGGEYVKAEWQYDHSAIQIHCRDWTGVLMDEKNVLTKQSGVETQNQSVGQIVTSIANKYGLKPVLHLTSDPTPSNTTIGSQFGSEDRTYMPRAQSGWATLTSLARANGYEVHTTPDKELVFGEPGAGLPTLMLAYQQNPVPSGFIPVRSLQIEHNPRRNKSFKVVVQSYDPSSAQITRGESVVIGSNMSTQNNQTINTGQWSGAAAYQASNSLSAGKKKVPIYTFRADGLTADQAQQRADSIATDIAKRELILSVMADTVPSIQLMQKMKLQGPTIEPEFAAHDYWLNSFTHEMHMAAGARGAHAEFSTHMKALDVQDLGEGDSVSTGKGRRGRGRVANPKTPGMLE